MVAILFAYMVLSVGIVRQLGGKNPPHLGTIPFWLYIGPTDLVSVFLDVGNLQITYKDLPTRFSSFFL